MRELKKYQLRATSRPAKWQGKIANTVVVRDAQGKVGYQYFNFDPSFITDVGKALPAGVSERNPAMVKVEYSEVIGKWLVGAHYVYRETPPVILWQADERPKWTLKPGQRTTPCATSSPSTDSSVAERTP